MHVSIHGFLGLALLLLGAAAPSAGEPERDGARRWFPEACRLTLGVELEAFEDGEPAETDEARWNRHYRRGIDAVAGRDLDAAEAAFCRALEAAGSFGPRDVRFAETLDELGLVSYLRGDDETAEAMQGAAVAELLLALGPPTEDLLETAEKSCLSSVATYMVRLGWIFDRQGRGADVEPLLAEPYRVLGRGYVPGEALAGRLDWLIAQYLLIEDYAAADWLAALRGEPR